MEREMNDFFITSMPESRPADYYLGCLEGSVFLDFDNYDKELVCISRISFDGYGCYNFEDNQIIMNQKDSMIFKKNINSDILNQEDLSRIILKAIASIKDLSCNEALIEYGFI